MNEQKQSEWALWFCIGASLLWWAYIAYLIIKAWLS